MTYRQCLAIVAAILFKVKDKNPPHGIYESHDDAVARAIADAKAIIYASEER